MLGLYWIWLPHEVLPLDFHGQSVMFWLLNYEVKNGKPRRCCPFLLSVGSSVGLLVRRLIF